MQDYLRFFFLAFLLPFLDLESLINFLTLEDLDFLLAFLECLAFFTFLFFLFAMSMGRHSGLSEKVPQTILC